MVVLLCGTGIFLRAAKGGKGNKGLKRLKGQQGAKEAARESAREGFYLFLSPSALRVYKSAEFENCFIPAACDRSDYWSEFFCFCGSESF